jgi:hypothetical protein
MIDRLEAHDLIFNIFSELAPAFRLDVMGIDIANIDVIKVTLFALLRGVPQHLAGIGFRGYFPGGIFFGGFDA